MQDCTIRSDPVEDHAITATVEEDVVEDHAVVEDHILHLDHIITTFLPAEIIELLQKGDSLSSELLEVVSRA